jgi:hypothetical protein
MIARLGLRTPPLSSNQALDSVAGAETNQPGIEGVKGHVDEA